MSTLKEYLQQKREAGLLLREKAEQQPEYNRFSAKVKAKGRSGVREIRIRDFQVISDSPEDYAGYSLGPSSPELQLGVLGSCLTHITLIQASQRGVSLDALEVEVSGTSSTRWRAAPDTSIFRFSRTISATSCILHPPSHRKPLTRCIRPWRRPAQY